MSVTLRLAVLQYPWGWASCPCLGAADPQPHQGGFHLQSPIGAAKVRICAESGWRMLQNGEAGQRLLALESLVWSWLAALRVQDAQGRRFWLLSIRKRRSDQLFRRWINTLPQASAHSSTGDAFFAPKAEARP